MKSVYLVNPSERGILENAGDRVPLGLLSIGAHAKKHGLEVKVFDLNHTSEPDFMNQVAEDRPDAIGISVYTSPMYLESMRLAKQLRGNRLIAGGYHASALPGTLAKYFDAAVIGEGESGFLRALEQDGIIDGTTEDLTRLENPDRSLLDMSKYQMDTDGLRTATLATSRGCPYSCSFCFNISKRVRATPLVKVYEQIRQSKEEGFEALYFTDDVFTMDPSRATQIARETTLPFRVTSRVDLLNKEILIDLRKNGCDWVSMGIESGDDEILKLSNKRTNTKQAYDVVRMASSEGISTKGFFIIGLPGETEESAKRTIEFSQSLKQNGLTKADFYFLTPFPGTPIWNDPKKFGITIDDLDFTNYLQAGKKAKCVISTEHLKSSRIEQLVEEAKSLWQK